MANRRMFTKQITDSDEFISLSSSAQALYFHLNMGADDDGFNNQIQNAMFKAHSTADDFNILLSKKFIIRFESGVIVIKHWRVHNYIQNDRHKDTLYQKEINQLTFEKSGEYEVDVSKVDTECIQNVSEADPQVRLGKVRLVKDSLDKDNIPPISPQGDDGEREESENILNDKELQTLFNEFVSMRKQMKKPMTDRARKMALNRLEELSKGDIKKKKDIIEQSIFHCWDSFYDIKQEQQQVPTKDRVAEVAARLKRENEQRAKEREEAIRQEREEAAKREEAQRKYWEGHDGF